MIIQSEAVMCSEDGSATGTTPPPAASVDEPSTDRELPDGRLQKMWLKAIRVIAMTSGMVLAMTAIAAWLPDSWWRLWLLQHLRPQIALASLFVVPVLLLARCWRTVAAIAVPLLCNGGVLLPLFFGGSTGDPVLSVTHVNVDRDKVAVLEYANEYGSDIVFLQEVQPKIEAEFDAMADYRLVISNPEPDTRGSAMLVRKGWEGRVVESEVVQLHGYYRPFIAATVETKGQTVSLLSFHAIRPFAHKTISAHQNEMENLATWVSKQDHPVIVVGDFNATPWSNAIEPLKDQGLAVSANGHGLQPTWPASLPTPLRIPIDICLHSKEWTTVSHSIGDNVGSDHLPVHLEFGIS